MSTTTATFARKSKQTAQRQRLLWAALRFLIVLVGSLFFVLPSLWMITTSFKPDYQVWLIPPRWIPDYFVWENYGKPLEMLPFPRFYLNTVVIVALNLLGTVLSSSLIAYGFARLRFPGRNALFVLVLSTLMLPAHVTLIPQYLLFSRLKWINTYLPLALPSFFGGAFSIFLLRQFMATITRDLDDAAKIDGAGYFGIYNRIILPLCRPALGVVAINAVTAHWNDFLHPLVYLQKQDLYTISLGLRMIQGNYFGDWPVQYIMAMTFISIIPIVALFFLAQRYFLRGIVLSSYK
jgi:ABC-type glycerol-3-phosphate transport system permease component